MNTNNTNDTIPQERVIVTLSGGGFIKRIPAAVYRSQHRRGKGVKGMGIREADAIKLLVTADTQDNLFFFTNLGKVFSLKTFEIPSDAARTAKGLPIVDIIPAIEGEIVNAVVPIFALKPDLFFVMATGKGKITRDPLQTL